MDKNLELISSALSVPINKYSDLESLLTHSPIGVIDFRLENDQEMDASITRYLTVSEIIEETQAIRLFHQQEKDLDDLPRDLIVISIDEGGNYLLFDMVYGSVHFIHHEMPHDVCLVAKSVSDFRSRLHAPEEAGDVDGEVIYTDPEFMAIQKHIGNTLE